MNRDERAELRRLLRDLGDFLTQYAWTDQHDESYALYQRIGEAQERLSRDDAAQGDARPSVDNPLH